MLVGVRLPRRCRAPSPALRHVAVAAGTGRELGASGQVLANDALHDWGADMLALDEASHGHALLVYGVTLFRHHDLLSACALEERTR